ncbi:MAG: TrkH family potassium uptake protein, partial [Fuerstiella sp.]|nr:TrkH family potassium uptake protein [Fuerstiella sp.]
MNWALVARLLGLISLLIGGSMVVTLPWSYPWFGQTVVFEKVAFGGMLRSIAVCGVVGALLLFGGRTAKEKLLRKEALAVVGVGWILCGILGALPFLLTPTYRMPA